MSHSGLKFEKKNALSSKIVVLNYEVIRFSAKLLWEVKQEVIPQ